MYKYTIHIVVGIWSPMDSLNLTRIAEPVAAGVMLASPMANKSFIVTVLENPPYTMLKLTVLTLSILKYINITSPLSACAMPRNG